MRILFAVHTYEPEANGVQMVTKYLAEGLAKNHEVFCLTDRKVEKNTGEMYLDHEMINGVQVYRRRITDETLPENERKDSYLRVVYDVNPEVLIVVCTQIWTFDYIIDSLDKLACKKILYTHGFSHLKWTVGNVIRNNIKKKTLRAIPTELRYVKHGRDYYKNLAPVIAKFDSVTYLSENDDSYKWACAQGLTNSVVITNACDDWFFENAKIADNNLVGEHPLTFIYVANYERRKNQKLLVEAYIRANIANSRLVMIGKGDEEYYKQVQQQIKDTNNIVAEYNIPRSKVLDYYLQSDVAVTTSNWEAFSITLCEAAAMGLPIISTNVGNAASFDGIILADTVEEIAAAMNKMTDASQRTVHGRRLHDYALKNCKVDSRVEMLEKLF